MIKISVYSDTPTYLLSKIGNEFLNNANFRVVEENFVPGKHLQVESDETILLLISSSVYQAIDDSSDYEDLQQRISHYIANLEESIKEAVDNQSVVLIPRVPTHYLYKSENPKEYISPRGHSFKISLFNNELALKLNHHTNINLCEGIGHFSSIHSKEWHRFKSLYNIENSQKIINNIKNSINKPREENIKKLIILDLDNTLWKGIIGEDGSQGVRMGEHDPIGSIFHEVQKKLLELKRNGFVLAINSKNNHETAFSVIKDHNECLMREDDFVSIKINWKLKSENIREICTELNLSPTHAIFIDDNERECEEVRQAIDGITTITVPKKLYEYPQIFNSDIFYTRWDEDNGIDRTKAYQTRVLRKQSLDSYISSGNTENWIKTLQLKIKISQLNKSSRDLSRICQLYNRTNQFNLSANRYSLAEILEIIGDTNKRIFYANVEDKYGVEGVVLSCIIEMSKEKEQITITDFVMSCRVFGRTIEHAFLENCISIYQNTDLIYFNYVDSGRNHAAKEFIQTNLGKNQLEIETRKLQNTLKEAYLDSEIVVDKLPIAI